MTTSKSPRLLLGVALMAIAQVTFAAETEMPASAASDAMAPAPTTTLGRIQSEGKIVLGYLADARPFSYRDADGKAAGFAVSLCEKVMDRLKAGSGLGAVAVEWKPVDGQGLDAVQRGTVDLLCAANPVTLGTRATVSFSAPIFPGGTSAVMSSDASERLKAVLEQRPPPYQPVWRGTPLPKALYYRTFSAVSGSPAATWLQERIDTFDLNATSAPVDSVDAGVARVASGDSDVFFAERAALLDAVARSPAAKRLVVLTRRFEFESLAFALARNNDDFRLAVDRALTNVYLDPEFGALYAKAFGTPDADTVAFFRATAVREK